MAGEYQPSAKTIMIAYRVVTTITEEDRTVVKETTCSGVRVETVIEKALAACAQYPVTISVEPELAADERSQVEKSLLL